MSRAYDVPSKDYGRQHDALRAELMPEIERVLAEENPILGESVGAFEAAFAKHAGTAFAVGLNSGTDALILALRALGIGPGDEVVVPANTFIATITAVIANGATAVLVDPDPDTLNMTGPGVERAITDRTRAVIPVHLYGRLAPMAEIEAITAARGVAIVEDAAQAHGAMDADGRRAGAFGVAGCFSFHPSKNLGAFGDAGLVTTDDAAIAHALTELRNLGKATKYEVRHVAPNTKLDTLQAAVLRIKLRRLDEWNARRRALAARYRNALSGVGDLRLPTDPGGEAHVYHLFVARTSHRDELRAFLKENGVNAGVHYPIPPHRQPLGVDLGYAPGSLPVTEAAAREVISLPIAPELTDAEIGSVCERVRAFFDRETRERRT